SSPMVDTRGRDCKDAPLEVALRCLQARISVIPIRRDGSKAPACSTWKEHQAGPTGEEQARRWWGRRSPPGIAALGGGASAGLELLDFDREADVIFPRWRSLVEEAAPGLYGRLSVVRTPRRPVGYHVWFRCGDMDTPGNDKLAELSPAERAVEEALAEQ